MSLYALLILCIQVKPSITLKEQERMVCDLYVAMKVIQKTDAFCFLVLLRLTNVLRVRFYNFVYGQMQWGNFYLRDCDTKSCYKKEIAEMKIFGE